MLTLIDYNFNYVRDLVATYMDKASEKFMYIGSWFEAKSCCCIGVLVQTVRGGYDTQSGCFLCKDAL